MATSLRLGASRNLHRNALVKSSCSFGPTFSNVGLRYKSTATSKEPRKSWSDTLLLPQTSFPMKHKDIVKEENKWRDRTSTEFYKWQVRQPFCELDGHNISWLIMAYTVGT